MKAIDRPSVDGLNNQPTFSHAGIMAILLAAIVMSHYTHSNLSLVTQINMQQTLRAVSFMAGECLPTSPPRY